MNENQIARCRAIALALEDVAASAEAGHRHHDYCLSDLEEERTHLDKLIDDLRS